MNDLSAQSRVPLPLRETFYLVDVSSCILCCVCLNITYNPELCLNQRIGPICKTRDFICSFLLQVKSENREGIEICVKWDWFNWKELQEKNYIAWNGRNLVWTSHRWCNSGVSLCSPPIFRLEKESNGSQQKNAKCWAVSIGPGISPWLG